MGESTPGDLPEDLDANADYCNGAEDGQDDRQNGADAIHDVGGHGGKARAKRGHDGIGSSLNNPLLPLKIMLCE